MLDDYLIIRQDNELNHSDRAQVNIYIQTKTLPINSVQFPYHHILMDYTTGCIKKN